MSSRSRRPMVLRPFPKRQRRDEPSPSASYSPLHAPPSPFSNPSSSDTGHSPRSASSPHPASSGRAAPSPAPAPSGFPTNNPDAKLTLPALRALRAAVLARGTPDDILAFKLTHELLFSPTMGLADATLAPLSRALRGIPTVRAGDRELAPLASFPHPLRSLLSEGADLPRVVDYVPPESVPGYGAAGDGAGIERGARGQGFGQADHPSSAPANPTNVGPGAGAAVVDVEAEAAVRALADNVRYAFEYYIPRDPRMRRTRVWRGVPADAAQQMLAPGAKLPLLPLPQLPAGMAIHPRDQQQMQMQMQMQIQSHAQLQLQLQRMQQPSVEEKLSNDDRVAMDPLFNEIMARRCRGYVAVRPRVPRLLSPLPTTTTTTTSAAMSSPASVSTAANGSDTGRGAMVM